MINSQIPLVISIAILYSYFFQKLSDIVLNQHGLDTMCGDEYGFRLSVLNTSPENEQCWKEKKILREQTDTYKFYMLLIAGVAGVMASSQLKNPTASMGIGLGGGLTILHSTYIYWNHFNEIVKLGGVGVSLCVLLYTAMKMFKL